MQPALKTHSAPPASGAMEEPTLFPGPFTDGPGWSESAQSSSQAGGNFAGRLLGYLHFHWVMLVFAGTCLATALAFAAWKLIPAPYTTYTLLQVSLHPSRVTEMVPEATSRHDFLTYLKTQKQLITSYYVLNAALRDRQIAELTMLRDRDDPVRFLEEKLQVDFSDGSEIIRLALQGDHPEEIAKIVDAVQNAYFREIVQVEQNQKKARLKRLEDAKVRLNQLLTKEFDTLKDRSDLKPADPDRKAELLRSNDLARNTIRTYEKELVTAKTAIQKAQATIDRLNQKVQNPPLPANFDFALEQALEQDPEVQQMEAVIAAKETIYQHFRYINETAPQTLQVRATLESLRAECDQYKQQQALQFRETSLASVREQFQERLEQAESDLQVMLSERAHIEQALTKAKESLQPIESIAEIPPNLDRMEMEKRKERIQQVIDQIQLMELEVDAPPRVQRLMDKAAVPRQRETKKRLLGTVFAGLMGFFVIALGIVAYESRVQRVMSLEDVQQVARAPVLGVIPWSTGMEGRRLNAQQTASWMNNHAMVEALEKTRTRAVQQVSTPQGRVVMVTSSHTEEARPFLTWKLTMSLAKSGERTLLMDFDLRTPSMHEFIGVGNEEGVCEVLRGQTDVRRSIQTLSEGLCFLPAGKWCDQLRQELAREKIGGLFARLREHFDCIVVHSHAMLAVSDTYLTGQHVDMIVLSILKYQSRLPLLSRAQERMLALGRRQIGLVYLGGSNDETLC